MSRGPGQRAGISHDEVVAAARRILATDGLEAVSMRRVAAGLGVAPNTLYSHVPDKSALVDALIDDVLGDIAVPAAGTWRERLEGLLTDTRRVLLEHPQLIPAMQSRQTLGTNAMRLGEQMLTLLHQGGVRGEDAVRAMQVLLVHTVGAAAFEVPRRDDPDPIARRRRGHTATQTLDPTTHPHITRLGAAIAEHPGDTVFRRGLAWLLDGVTADG